VRARTVADITMVSNTVIPRVREPFSYSGDVSDKVQSRNDLLLAAGLIIGTVLWFIYWFNDNFFTTFKEMWLSPHPLGKIFALFTLAFPVIIGGAAIIFALGIIKEELFTHKQ
jgi:hypothetical protein